MTKKILLLLFSLIFFSVRVCSQSDGQRTCLVKISNHLKIRGKFRPRTFKPEYEMRFDSEGKVVWKKREANYILGSPPYFFTQTYTYDRDRIVKIERYEEKNGFQSEETNITTFIYNQSGLLIEKKHFQILNTDTLKNSVKYVHDGFGVTLVNPGKISIHYEVKSSNGEVNKVSQYYKDTLRWKTNYVYSDSLDIETTETFYKTSPNFSEQVKILRKNARVRSIERKNTQIGSGFEINHKMIIYYGEDGFLNKIESFFFNEKRKIFQLSDYQHIKIENGEMIKPDKIQLINVEIIKQFSDVPLFRFAQFELY